MGRRDKRRKKKAQKERADEKIEEQRLNPKVKCPVCGTKYKSNAKHECPE